MTHVDQAFISELKAQGTGLAGLPLVLGFSGGLDSSVLLHGLVLAGFAGRLRAVHVDHGLHPRSDAWLAHCRQQAERLGVPLTARRIRLSAGGNLEERARDARRAVLVEETPEGGVLVLAHHLDDQLETLLLRLVRGTGIAGLAGMSCVGDWQGRRLWRPLLNRDRAQLEAMAAAWSLDWVEDPANNDQAFDRNYLRHQVVPRLRQRWPALPSAARTLFDNLSESAGVLEDQAEADFVACGGDRESLDSFRLASLSGARRRNLLVWWIRSRGMRVPVRDWLMRVDRELLAAGADRQPQLRWADGMLLRSRGRLYLLREHEFEPLADQPRQWSLEGGEMRHGPLCLFAEKVAADATDRFCIAARLDQLVVRPAVGGERLLRNGMHQRVKELWRRNDVPSWRRRQMPLFYHGDELVAAGGAGVADPWRAAVGEPAWRLHWKWTMS